MSRVLAPKQNEKMNRGHSGGAGYDRGGCTLADTDPRAAFASIVVRTSDDTMVVSLTRE